MNIQIKTTFSYIRRSPFQSMAAIFVLTLTFFVTTLILTLAYGSSRVVNYFETRPQVIAFLKDTATDTDVSGLESRLEATGRVKDIKYVSKEQALTIYKNATSDNPLLGQLVSPSIFPSSIEFSVTDLNFAKDLIEQLKTDSSVDSVGFTAAIGGEASLKDVVSRLKTFSNYIRIGGSSFVLVLSLTSFIVLLVIITLRMSMRREEIEILKLIGATQRFIRSPIILEALFYSLTGVIAGWALAFILVLFTAPSVIAYFGEIPILPTGALPIVELFAKFLLVEVVAGLVLAMSGSLFAISRAKKSR